MLTALRDSEKKLEYLLVNQEVSNESNHSSIANQVDFDNNEITQESQENPIFNLFQNNVAQQNEIGNKLLISEKKLQALHEHQSMLMQLQEKAENRMKDARKAQERLQAHANSFPYSLSPIMNEINHAEPKLDNNKSFDSSDCKEMDEVPVLNQANENCEQMMRLLDARDSELANEQIALHQKLQDLNNKKQQIDHLVSQLHNYGIGDEEGTDEMAKQIKQIVAMKEQLATLKGLVMFYLL